MGDLLDAEDGILDGSAGCPTVRVANGKVLDPAAFDALLGEPNCFTFHKPFAGNPNGFPGGFTPRFGGDYVDSSVVAGLRSTLTARLFWDASVGVGSSEIDMFIYNTVNASLGPDSPTEFKPGTARQNETNLNFDLAYALSDEIHLAGGAEWRNETFVNGLGDEASWRVGPLAAQGFSSGSNGFPGFGPITVGSWSRSNYAAYGDIEIGGAGRRYTVGAALRGERFADFGTTVNYKAVGRFEIARGLTVRGGASTGFRAPTPGQQNSYNVTTALDPGTNVVINQGTIPPTSQVASFVGGEGLGPERSRNYTAGAIFEHGPFSLTADYFRIELADRLWFSRLFALTTQQVDQLVAEGVVDAANLTKFRFFTNDFDTTTHGVDLIATYAPTALDGNSVFSFLLNHTGTAVADYNPETVTPARINLLESALPEMRWNFTVRHQAGRFHVLVRVSYWGDFFDREDNRGYPGEHLADVEATYDLTRAFSLSLGAQNVFNTYPARNPDAHLRLGNLYPQSTPFGFNGGYYYMRFNYKWDRAQ